MEIKRLKLADIHPAPYNPRTISDASLAGLSASVKRWGCVEPLVVNTRTGNTLVAGHQRLKALLAAGDTEADCVLVDLPVSEEKALNIALNNPHIQGEFTPDVAGILESLKIELPDLPPELAFDALLEDAPQPEVGEIVEDEVPEPPKVPITKPGDLWILGQTVTCPKCKHRQAV